MGAELSCCNRSEGFREKDGGENHACRQQKKKGAKERERGREDEEDNIMTTEVMWGETGETDLPGKMNSLQTFQEKEGFSK